MAASDKSPKETVSDQWIHTKVKSALIANPKITARNINVDVDKGVVTLKGVVASSAEKKAAIGEARNISGVKKVKNKLFISR